MTMLKGMLVTSVVMIACTSTAAAQALQDYSGTYLCKLTASAGLRLNTQSQTWNGVIFNVSDTSLLMKIEDLGTTEPKVKTGYPQYHIEFKDFGSTNEPMRCFSNFASVSYEREVSIIDGRINCRAFGTAYQVNLKDNKILVQFEGAYMDDWTENQDTPYVAVGVCDKVS